MPLVGLQHWWLWNGCPLTIPGARNIPTSLTFLHPPLIPPPHRASSQGCLTGCHKTGKQKLQHAFFRQAGTSTKAKANTTEIELKWLQMHIFNEAKKTTSMICTPNFTFFISSKKLFYLSNHMLFYLSNHRNLFYLSNHIN